MQSWPLTRQPRITRDNIGPRLTMRDGTVHWLTAAERFALCLGLTTAARLEAKLRPDLAAYDDAMKGSA